MRATPQQENKPMGSKTIVLNPKPGDDTAPAITLGIQSDTAFAEETKRLQGAISAP